MPFPPGLVWFSGLATSKIPAGLACYFLRGRCLARGTLGLFRLVKTQIFEASKIGSMSENMGIEPLKNAQREPPEWSNPERSRFCCKKYSTQFCATITLHEFIWLSDACIQFKWHWPMLSSSIFLAWRWLRCWPPFVITLCHHSSSSPFVNTLRHHPSSYSVMIPVWVSSRISEGLTPPKEGWFSAVRKARICWNDAFEVPPIFYRTTFGDLWVVRSWFSG